MQLGVIAAVALAVRVAYVLWYSHSTPVGYDANAYLRLAYGLSHHRQYGAHGVATALFPPGFPMFLAVLQVFGLNHFTELLVGMACLGTVTTVCIALLARHMAGDATGLVAGAIAAIYPNLFLAEGALMTEALTALLVTLALLCALRAIDRPTPGRFVVLGLPLAYGALTRSDGWFFAIALVAVVAWCVTTQTEDDGGSGGNGGNTSARRDWRRFAKLVAAGLVASIVLVGSWLVRNEVRMHAFVPVAVNTWDVVAGANCARTYSGDRFGSWDSRCLDLEAAYRAGRRGEIAVNQYARDQGIDYLKAHAGHLPAVVAARVGLTFGFYDPWHELNVESEFEGRDAGLSKVGYVMYLVLLLLAIAGFVRTGSGPVRRVLIVPFVTVLLSTIVGYGNQRFRMPLEPVIVVLAAVALTARNLPRFSTPTSPPVGSMR